MFYVYSYVKGKTPYYVGKGCGNRAYQKENHPPLPAPQDTHFLGEYSEEVSALLREWELITLFGLESEGGMLVNKVKGCCPPSQTGKKWRHTEETKQRMRKPKNYKRTAEHSEKIAKQNRGKKHTEEHKRNITEGLLQNREKLQNFGNTNRAKTYLVTTPEGEVLEVTNLAPFCREHNLTRSSMCKVAQGKANHHKKYKVCYK